MPGFFLIFITMRIILSFLLVSISVMLTAQSGSAEIEQPVYLENDTISGTLLTDFPLSAKKNKKKPLVIIIPGSGPTDRNGNSAMLPGPNDSYKQLADSLYVRGISSYRYDKLGIGASSKDIDESEMRFSTNVEMVEAIYREMTDLGFRRVYLIGHSEGALIGSMAAQKLDIEGLILIAGSGREFMDLIEEQLRGQFSADILNSTMHKLDSIKQGYTVENKNVLLQSLLRESIQPYLKELLNLNPMEELSKVGVPVMLIQGEQDFQVNTRDLEGLKNARPDADVKLYPNMNHVLKVVKTPQENQASYSDPDFRLEPALPADIASWINK